MAPPVGKSPPKVPQDEKTKKTESKTGDAQINSSGGGLLSKITHSSIVSVFTAIPRGISTYIQNRALKKIQISELQKFLLNNTTDTTAQDRIKVFLPDVLQNYSLSELRIITRIFQHPGQRNSLINELSKKDQPRKEVRRSIANIKGYLNTMVTLPTRIEKLLSDTNMGNPDHSNHKKLLDALEEPAKMSHVLDLVEAAENIQKVRKPSPLTLITTHQTLINSLSEENQFLQELDKLIFTRFYEKCNLQEFRTSLLDQSNKLTDKSLTKETQEAILMFIQSSPENSALFSLFLNEISSLKNRGITYKNQEELKPLYGLLGQICQKQPPDSVIQSLEVMMRKELQLEAKVQELSSRAGYLIGNRMTHETRQVLESALVKVNGMIDKFEEFVAAAEEYQRARPKIFPNTELAKDLIETQVNIISLITQAETDRIHKPNKENPLLQNSVFKAITETTSSSNSQYIEETLTTMVESTATRGPRDIPILRSAETNSYENVWRPTNESFPPFQLLENDDSKKIFLDFSLEVDLLEPPDPLTNKESMETLALRLPFPFKGEMTVTEARTLIGFVRETSDSPSALKSDEAFLNALTGLSNTFLNEPFNYTYETIPQAIKTQLEQEQGISLATLPEDEAFRKLREYMREKISSFSLDSQMLISKGVANFNETINSENKIIPQRWVVFEQPEFKAYHETPLDPEKALGAAKTGNSFRREDGRLSLLPDVHEELEPFVTLQCDIQIVKEELLDKKTVTIEEPLGEIQNQQLTSSPLPMTLTLKPYQFSSEINKDTHYLEATFSSEIEIDGKKHTLIRKKYYTWDNDQTQEKVIDDIANSGLLERDFLLTKAKFMRDTADLRAGKQIL